MLSTPKAKGELFLASSLCDGLEDNNIKQVTTLLESKEADPNVLLPLHGITPFHLVIGNESELFAEKVTKLFLRHGGNPNVKSIDGMTPVHVAAAWGRVKVLELLLANGGDPLCLDDDGRSPFHYAFDGSYYDAITVLGKYCTKSRDVDDDDDDGEEEENEPKIKIKLEKILVNRGDVIAEYVPSEIDLTNDTQYETKENIVSKSELGCSLANNSEHEDRSGTDSTEINSSPSDESPNLNSNNITYRRGQFHTTKNNAISPILAVDNFNFDLGEGNVVEEKILISQIINRLSNSFNISGKKLKDINVKKNTVKNHNANKFSSLIPQPKYFKNNLNSKKAAIEATLLDTSIVSKSPNFKIPIKKRNDGTTAGFRLKGESPNWTKKYFTPKKTDLSPTAMLSSNATAPKTKGASSTPKRKPKQSRYEMKKLSANQERDRSRNKTPLGRTYIENNYDIPSSPDNERKSKIASGKKLYRNVARKLDNTMYDEDVETDPRANNSDDDQWKQLKVKRKSPDVRSKLTKISSNVDSKNIVGITQIKSDPQRINHQELKIDQDTPSQITDTNIQKKYERNQAFLESPGSSRPTSASYQYKLFKTESDSNDELEMWKEIDAIYNDKGQTPPASISKLIDDSLTSLNTSKSSTSIEKEKATFSIKNTSDNSIVHMVDQENSNSSEDRERFNQSSNTEDYRTPLRSTISSRPSMESFMSVDEEYAYVDAEKDVAFMERRLRVLSKVEDMNRAMYESTWLNRHGELSSAASQISPRSSGEFDRIFKRGEFLVSNTSLRHQLIALGDAPGPITDTTHYVYLKRLYKLKRENTSNLNECFMTSQSRNEIIPKSPTISKTLLVTDWITNSQFYRDLEELAFREYERPNDRRRYQGGMAKTSFNYLLLDPRVTNDLPRKGRDLCLAERWKIFLKAIFYVGKGKNARPFQHLYQSHKIWTGSGRDYESNEKIQRILNIWRDGKGVICHQVFINSMQEEAFTREAAMIDALGTNHLSNCQRGHYYGLAATMNREEKMALGKYLLYKAMEILMHDGERQQFPRNIE